MNIAEEIARKLEMNYVFGHEFQELAQRSTKIHFAKSGSPPRRLSIPSKQTPWPTTLCHSFTAAVFGDSFALYLRIKRAGPQTPSERPPKYAPAVLR
jgi:hypothetical protein